MTLITVLQQDGHGAQLKKTKSFHLMGVYAIVIGFAAVQALHETFGPRRVFLSDHPVNFSLTYETFVFALMGVHRELNYWMSAPGLAWTACRELMNELNNRIVAAQVMPQIEDETQQRGCCSYLMRFTSKLFKPAHNPVRRAGNDREQPLFNRRQGV